MVLRIVQWIVGAVVAVALLLAGAVAIARWQLPTAKQAASLRLLTPVAPSGRNGFAQGWLLSYDVPLADVDAVMAKELSAFADANLRAVSAGDRMKLFLWSAKAADAHGSAGFEGDRQSAAPLRCDGESCLASVRASLPAYEARAKTPEWRNLYARYDAMLQADYLGSPFVPAPQPPMPAYQTYLVGGSRNAYWFARGEKLRALASACHEVTAWSRFHLQADSLPAAMIYGAGARRGITQAAEFLSELSADLALPAECREAFPVAPIEASVDACPMMRKEFTYVSATVKLVVDDASKKAPAWQRPWSWLIMDGEVAKLQYAEPMAQACATDTREAVRADRPVRLDPPAVTSSYWDPSCFASITTCILSSEGGTPWADYLQRGQDLGAERQLGATLVWLRDHPDDRPLAVRLADRPDALKLAGHAVTVGADEKSLQIPLFQPRTGRRTFSLPMYASRYGTARGGSTLQE